MRTLDLDELLDHWAIEVSALSTRSATPKPVEATCSCGSGIPVQKVNIDGQTVTLIALPAILQQFRELGTLPGGDAARGLLDMVKVYNPVTVEQEASYLSVLEQEYAAFCAKQ